MIVLSAIASNEVDAMVEARSAVRTTQKFVLVGGRSRVHASSQETPAELAVVVLGYAVPSTRHEWQKLSHRIMGDLSHTLQVINFAACPRSFSPRPFAGNRPHCPRV
jgi:hypothetical protein